MIDLLRAIHFSQPPSFPTSVILQRIRTKNLGAVCALINTDRDQNEDALLDLLSLLSDFYTATLFSIPLASLSTAQDGQIYSHLGLAWNGIPFTPIYEVHKTMQKLSEELKSWQAAKFDLISNQLKLLYHFCHLVSLVPQLPHLMALSGYSRSSPDLATFDTEKQTRGSLDLPMYFTASPTSWKLLETSELIPTDELPIWSPLSVFSAGLVIWARMKFTEPKDQEMLSTRSLDPFQIELARMNFPCAEHMSMTLIHLRQTLFRRPRG